MINSAIILPVIDALSADQRLTVFRSGISGKFLWLETIRKFKVDATTNAGLLLRDLRLTAVGNTFMESISGLSASFVQNFSSNSDLTAYNRYTSMNISQRIIDGEKTTVSIKNDFCRSQVKSQQDKDNNFVLNIALFIHFYMNKIFSVMDCPTEVQQKTLESLLDEKYQVDESLKNIVKEFHNARTHLITCMKEDEKELFNSILMKIISSELELVANNKQIRLLQYLKKEVDRSVYNDTKRKFKFWDAEPAEGISLLREKLATLPVIKAHMVDDLFVQTDEKAATNEQNLKLIKKIAKDVETILLDKVSHDSWKRFKIVRDLYNDSVQALQRIALLEPGSFTVNNQQNEVQHGCYT